MQNIKETGLPFLVTLNPPQTPEHTLLKWSTGHPIPSVTASKASSELNLIQGKRKIWFCGAYQGMLNKSHWYFENCNREYELNYPVLHFVSGYGFHEDGLKVLMHMIR